MKIGIVGLAGAGKDTFAKMLYNALPKGSACISRYASPLKAAAEYVFGPTFDDRDVKEFEREVYIPATSLTPLSSRKFSNGFLANRLYQICKANGAQAALNVGYRFGFNAVLSPRQFQQWLGTEVVRKQCGEQYFVGLLNYKLGSEYTIIPDTRFANEADNADVLVFVNYPGAVPVAPHSSEALAFDWATNGPPTPVIVVDNIGTLADLDAKAISVAYAITRGCYASKH